MKPTKKKAYALYDTDDQGYPRGLPIQVTTLAAALKPSTYQCTREITLLDFDGDMYAVKQDIHKNKFVGKIPSFVPTIVYHDYSYSGFSTQAAVNMYVTPNSLLTHIAQKKDVHLTETIVIADDEDGFYELSYADKLTLTPFKLTRELAYQNAMNKLTDEEKKLLGLA
jgi:hypothetical protein